MRKCLKFVLTFLFFVLAFSAQAQQGCTDPLANNYDPNATINDGSCQYPETNYSLELVAQLPSSIRECSGLMMIDEQLWAHNDGGNTPMLFNLDTLTGNILRSIRLAPGNWDWEDIAQSEDHFFIGDFGNNDGARQNLIIYQIEQSELALDTIWTVDTISFSFLDQTDYTPANLNTPYDCEAFFYLEDSLHIFTKDWVNNKTKVYTIPASPGHYDMMPRDSFEVEGLVTGADVASDGVVSLMGDNALGSFMWLLFDYTGTEFFSGHKRKISLDNFTVLGQTEGITFSRAGEGYIGSEEIFTFPAKLFKFTSRQWTDPFTTPINDLTSKIVIAPNPFSDFLQIENTGLDQVTLLLFDPLGRKVDTKLLEGTRQWTWDLPNLSPGYYTLMVQRKEGVKTHRVVKIK